MEESKTGARQTSNFGRSSQADHRDGRNECRLGCSSNPWELLEQGIKISEITVSRYMPKFPPLAGYGQRWATFLRDHLHEALALDFAVVPAATLGIVYVFFVLGLERRRVLHFNVTRHPTAERTAQQVVEACPFDLPGRLLILDNDKIYGTRFCNRVDGLGLEQIRTALLFAPA